MRLERDEWRTPPEVWGFFDRLHGFDIDLAASDENALCPAWITAAENGPEQAWAAGIGRAGWCNPPYSRGWIERFMHTAIEEARQGFTTVMLVPTPSGERRYERYVFGVASEVWFFDARLAFIGADGRPVRGNRYGSIVAVYRGYDLGDTRCKCVSLADTMLIGGDYVRREYLRSCTGSGTAAAPARPGLRDYAQRRLDDAGRYNPSL